MNKLPEYVYVQLDDEDDGNKWFTCVDKKEKLEFTPSNRHPVAKYKIVIEE